MRKNVGDKETLEHRITRGEIRMFRWLSEDDNSVHSGKDGIVYGAMLLSFVSTMIGTRLPGDGAIWSSSSCMFIQPAYAGDTITIAAEIVKQSGDKVKITYDLYNQKKELLLAGWAWIKVT